LKSHVKAESKLEHSAPAIDAGRLSVEVSALRRK
jgi:hypothetical protein